MLYAPLGRVYTETYAKDADMDKLIPYTLNKVQRPSGMSDALAYLYDWKKNWSGDCFCYEYHFWMQQYIDQSGMYLGKLLYDDIHSNITGIIIALVINSKTAVLLSLLHKNSSLRHYVSKMNVYKQLPQMNDELFNELLHIYKTIKS